MLKQALLRGLNLASHHCRPKRISCILIVSITEMMDNVHKCLQRERDIKIEWASALYREWTVSLKDMCISKYGVTIALPHEAKIAPFHRPKSIGYGLIDPYQTPSSSYLPLA